MALPNLNGKWLFVWTLGLKKAVVIDVEIPSDILKKKHYKIQEIPLIVRAKIAFVKCLNLQWVQWSSKHSELLPTNWNYRLQQIPETI